MQELRDIYGRHSLEFYEALEKSGISAEQRLEDAMDADVHEGMEVVRRVRCGRNSPCPCGSGKKFKKCCIHKAKQV